MSPYYVTTAEFRVQRAKSAACHTALATCHSSGELLHIGFSGFFA